jgi:hypothetical protein
VTGDVLALAVFDDGEGPALFAGGSFGSAGGAHVEGIAKWNGTSWSDVDIGLWFNRVQALAVFDDGTGPALFAGGSFTHAVGAQVRRIAKWDGTSWSALGGGMDGGFGDMTALHALAIFDDGTGPALFAGGDFTTAGGVSASCIAKWDGASWSALGSGLRGLVRALTVFDDGTGPALFAGGDFINAGDVSVSRIAKWNGTSWSPIGNSGGMNGAVHALTVFDDGAGPALFAGGEFTTAGGVSVNFIAKWNGASWSPLSNGVDSTVHSLAVFDDGTGSALFAGGTFATAGGVSASRIAKWDGASWSPTGNGADSAVRALAVFDDGKGPALFTGGDVTVEVGGLSARGIAKWDGTSWSCLGNGMGGGLEYAVGVLEVFDDGAGPALYAAGSFRSAGCVNANFAKWDGASWSAVGNSAGGTNSWVSALEVFDDGTGSALFVGGDFTTAGGVSANHIARWDGTSWSALGSGVNWEVYDLAVFDDGSGPALFAGGFFTIAGGISAKRIAKWDGTNWSSLGERERGG